MLLSSTHQVQSWSPSERVRVVNSNRSRTSCKFLVCTCLLFIVFAHAYASVHVANDCM